MTFAERIKQMRGKMTGPDFCAPLGVHRNTIYGWEKGVSQPSADIIVAMCSHYKVSPSWLILGEGPMYQGDPRQDGQANQHKSICDFDLIPMVETRLSAGDGAFVISENVEGYYAFKKQWVRRVATSAKSLVLLRVEGDSMQPTILTGDTVMIDIERKDVIEGRIYAIRFDSTVMIKRLSFRPANRIMVISDNKQEFDPYEVDRQELCILGQVIFFSRVLVHA